MSEAAAAPRISELLSLDEQRILVTGASGNIGRGIAVRLAEAGADIVVHYHADYDGAGETAAAVTAAGRNAESIRADLGIANEVSAMFAAIANGGAPLAGVVNNAGSYPVQLFTDMSVDEWRDVLSANLDSAANVCRETIRRWCEDDIAGAIVNVASIEATDPASGHSHYAVSKAGLVMLARSLTLEFGHRGIRVNTVSPGLIARADIERNWPEGVSRWLEHAPLGRLGEAADVADAALFLLGPASRWISGVNLVVDGGMSCVSRW